MADNNTPDVKAPANSATVQAPVTQPVERSVAASGLVAPAPVAESDAKVVADLSTPARTPEEAARQDALVNRGDEDQIRVDPFTTVPAKGRKVVELKDGTKAIDPKSGERPTEVATAQTLPAKNGATVPLHEVKQDFQAV